MRFYAKTKQKTQQYERDTRHQHTPPSKKLDHTTCRTLHYTEQTDVELPSARRRRGMHRQFDVCTLRPDCCCCTRSTQPCPGRTRLRVCVRTNLDRSQRFAQNSSRHQPNSESRHPPHPTPPHRLRTYLKRTLNKLLFPTSSTKR